MSQTPIELNQLGQQYTVDQQRFAQSIVTLLIGGVAGFLTGKNTK